MDRNSFLRLALVLLTAAPPLATSAPSVDPGPACPDSCRPWFGTLATGADHDAAEVGAGVGVGTLELSWAAYEPQNGVFDAGYAAEQARKLREMRAAGLRVALDAGLQYAPQWVFGLDPNTRYVDQYGDRYSSGTPGQDVPNGVFDPAVREAEAAYIARIAADLGDSFDFIRSGGGWFGELHYPAGRFGPHPASYWAFDAAAQAGSPVPGWRPGSCCAGQAEAFWDYYVSSLAGYEAWQLRAYRSHFSAWIEVLLPGWGVREGEGQAAVDGSLGGGSPAEVAGEAEQGTDFAAVLSALSDPKLIAYTTWLDAPDRSSGTAGLNPAAYLVAVTRHKLPVAGENTGVQSVAALELCVRRVRGLGLAGMSWAWEPSFFSGGSPRLSDYASLSSAGEV